MRVRSCTGHAPGASGKSFPTLRCGPLSGPSRTKGEFFDFEMGGHDGAYKGRLHVIVPFVGRKGGNLIDRQPSYSVLVLRVPGVEEGVMFGGEALGYMAETLIWVPGTRQANVPSMQPLMYGQRQGITVGMCSTGMLLITYRQVVALREPHGKKMEPEGTVLAAGYLKTPSASRISGE